MLFKDALYGIAIQRALIPEAVGLFLHFLGVEVCQHVFHLRNRLLTAAVTEHLQEMQLYRVYSSCIHLLISLSNIYFFVAQQGVAPR